ncbi:leucine-rich repeat domain-containing protein, partial [Anaplasma marginale]|uniref:leucine-rich repeat domain-containing protein n=1 Tax=Anaplasma marginale TaxID=770 RepID=UPI0018EA2D28
MGVAVANPSSHFKQSLVSQYPKEDLSEYFTDTILENAIRRKLNISEVEPIKRDRLWKINSLEIKETNLSKLDGIEYLTNLKKLILYGNKISDLTPLAQLSNLTELYLLDN